MTSKLEIITSWWEEIKNRLTDERVKIARAKKFRKLGYKTREGPEDWQRSNVPKSTGKSEGRGGKKHTPGKKEENKEKFLQQYGSQRTIIETFQEQPQKETQRKVYPDN